MKLTTQFLEELQKRLKVGNRRGVHLNAIPGRSRYKFDLNRFSHIQKDLPNKFITALLSEQPLKFRVSWKENVPDLNELFEEDQTQLVRITQSLENLINQTDAIESEKGINTFGFGFPLLIRRDEKDKKLTVAPVLIWSLRIKQTTEFNTWEIIRKEEDPIYVNEVLINHLESDSKVEIDQIPDEMLEDDLIDKEELLEICVNIIKSINTSYPDDLLESFRSKLENVVSIRDKSYYEKLPLLATNAFIEFGGVFSIFEVQKQNIISDYDRLIELKESELRLDDLKDHFFQPISSVETDPSQQGILHAMETSRNLLIQGPPGTGKSQTLTAILVNALENNKKVLVVCEKSNALEVLHKALEEKNLDNHAVLIRDIAKDRRLVVDSVRDRCDKQTGYTYYKNSAKASLEAIIGRARKIISEINNSHQKLHQELLTGKNWTYIVGEFLRELPDGSSGKNLRFTKSFLFNSIELNELLEIIKKGETLYNKFKSIGSKTFLNGDKLVGNNPYALQQKMHADFESYERFLKEIKVLQSEIKNEFFAIERKRIQDKIRNLENQKEDILIQSALINSIAENARFEYMNFRQSEFRNWEDRISQVVELLQPIFKRNRENNYFWDDEKLNSSLFKLISFFSSTHKAILNDNIEARNLLNEFENIYFEFNFIDLKKIPSSMVKKANFVNDFRSLQKTVYVDFHRYIEKEFRSLNLPTNSLLERNPLSDLDLGINRSTGEIKEVLRRIRGSYQQVLNEIDQKYKLLEKGLKTVKGLHFPYVFTSSLLQNEKILNKLSPALTLLFDTLEPTLEKEYNRINFLSVRADDYGIEQIRILQNTVSQLIQQFNSDNWIGEPLKSLTLDVLQKKIRSYLKLKEDYFGAEEDLFLIEFNWFRFYNDLTPDEREIIDKLKTESKWSERFLVFYFNSLLTSRATGDLPTNDNALEDLTDALHGLEEKQLRYIRALWSENEKKASHSFEMNHPDLMVKNLYNKRKSNRYKRHSLRQIVQSDADLFTAYFPVVLTTPDVASNLFKDMDGYFDIVMFDEASQLRLEDTLPAVLKGKQVIIAGDVHQMPPSNYFAKLLDGTVKDEDEIEEDEISINIKDVLLSCESLLDFATELDFNESFLDFHYRSQHPYLIDFSNAAFYKRRLQPLPQNFEYTPIKYVQVGGIFSDYQNEAEAEMVLSIIEKNIQRLPDGEYPSVGIATFNITQRNLIKRKILQRQKLRKFEEFNLKIKELEKNGFFIKNLENIQGDERDVIILSTTYGVGKDGRFAQRFGPVNHSKGYKLLNVIITRAKYKLYCVTSVPEDYFLDYKSFLEQEKSNNRRAAFYSYLAYCKAVSENNEEARLQILADLAQNTTNSSGKKYIPYGELESPFEEEVYDRLRDYYKEENLILQLQFAGFRIDIVYDSGIEGVPKIAIECDGAKYHSSREAYLYDRHRQKILEKHGFVFHRIWSTNWWSNPEREMNKLINFIKSVEKKQVALQTESPDTKLAFTDDVEIIDVPRLKPTPPVVPKEKKIIKKTKETPVDSQPFVPPGDRDMDTQPFLFPGDRSVDTQPSLFPSSGNSGYQMKIWNRVEVEDSVKEENPVKVENRIEMGDPVETMSPVKETIRIEKNNRVKIGSQVKVKYLNNGQILKIQLMEHENEVRTTQENGILKIYYRKPLAASLIGHDVGQIIQIGGLETYVEILEIKN